MPEARAQGRNWWPLVALLLFGGAYYWFFIRRVQAMRQHSKFTVGYVTGWTQTLKNGRAINYRCSIAGVAYSGSGHEEPGMNTTAGTRYVVAFDSLDPDNRWPYYDSPVPDSAQLPPATGWRAPALASRQARWHQADSLQMVQGQQ